VVGPALRTAMRPIAPSASQTSENQPTLVLWAPPTPTNPTRPRNTPSNRTGTGRSTGLREATTTTATSTAKTTNATTPAVECVMTPRPPEKPSTTVANPPTTRPRHDLSNRPLRSSAEVEKAPLVMRGR